MPITSRVTAAFALLLGGAVLAEDKQPIADAEFVTKAASGGMFEVESSKLARDGAASSEVKKFADQMIADHGKANKELMELAKKVGLDVPAKMLDPDQKLYDKVKAAKGAEFDKVYMDAQVKAHDDAVELFNNAAKNAKDPGLKAFAEKTLPVIKSHQEHAKKHAQK
jgi:putative membrane protein